MVQSCNFEGEHYIAHDRTDGHGVNTLLRMLAATISIALERLWFTFLNVSEKSFAVSTVLRVRGSQRCVWGLWLLPALLLPAMAQKVPVVQKQLSNGMTLLLVERHDEPTVAGGWVAHVGSSNERPGITGTAHLFEHMMFKGTPTIGTKDYKKDLEIIAAQEKIRDQIRQEERKMRKEYRLGEIDDMLKPENKTERYKELEKEFNKLIAEQREILVKNEFDRIYSGNGGSSM